MANWSQFADGITKGLDAGIKFGDTTIAGRKDRKLRKAGKRLADAKRNATGDVTFNPAEQPESALPVASGVDGGVAAPPVAQGSAPPVPAAPPPGALPLGDVAAPSVMAPGAQAVDAPAPAPTPGTTPMEAVPPEAPGDTGDFSLPSTEDIYALREEMADVYLQAGDIEGFTKAQDQIDKYLHQSFMQNAKQAEMLLAQGDNQAAGKALKRAYAFFPNGSDIDLQMKDGKLIGIGYEPGAEPGTQGKFKGAMVVTPDAINRMTRNFDNPEAYAQWDTTRMQLQNQIAQQTRGADFKEDAFDWTKKFKEKNFNFEEHKEEFNQWKGEIETNLKNNKDVRDGQDSSAKRKQQEQMGEYYKALSAKAMAEAEAEGSAAGGSGGLKPAEVRARAGDITGFMDKNRIKYLTNMDNDYGMDITPEAENVMGPDVYAMYKNDPTALAKNNAAAIKIASSQGGQFNPPEVISAVENARMYAINNQLAMRLVPGANGYEFEFAGQDGKPSKQPWQTFRGTEGAIPTGE